MTETTQAAQARNKLAGIAARMKEDLEHPAHEQAGDLFAHVRHKLAHGLELDLSRRKQGTVYVLELRRDRVAPSDVEVETVRRAFGVPAEGITRAGTTRYDDARGCQVHTVVVMWPVTAQESAAPAA